MGWILDFVSLVFPRICPGCGNSLWKNEEVLCTLCEFRLPKTGFHHEVINPVSRLFWGRVPVESATAWLYFHKGGRVQRLIHHLKYKGRKDIGIWLGKRFGYDIRDTVPFNSVSAIIPVPLHKKKYMKRGYNQSEQVAIGLSGPLNAPVNRFLLTRTKSTETQTRKSRFSRYQNVREIFTVAGPEAWANSHLLLVDDVVTTGATLESCIEALSVIPGVKISVACVAAASL